MKKTIYFLLLFLMTTGILRATEIVSEKADFPLKSDKQALEYCKSHKNCYIVIVWPRGFNSLEYVIEKLKLYAYVNYVKTMALNRNRAFLLYRKLHKKMSRQSAKKYFKPYISPSSQSQHHCAALVLSTAESLAVILQWKKEIRAHIGEGYHSIHINDYYDPETVEAACAVFKN